MRLKKQRLLQNNNSESRRRSKEDLVYESEEVPDFQEPAKTYSILDHFLRNKS